MNSTYEILFSIVRSRICGAPIDKAELTPENLKAAYILAKAHDIHHIVADVALSAGVEMPVELSSAFSKARMLAVYRYTQINAEFTSLCRTFEEAKIPFLPLKGSVIRPFYPSPELRSSCDIDIFVEKEDLERSLLILSDTLGYKLDKKSEYDISTYSPSGIHVELHFALDEDDERVRAAYEGIMERTVAKDGCEYHRLMTNEDFYAYHIIHAAKHFVHGGCGIRPFIDLYIIKTKMGFYPAGANKIMKSAGVDTFAASAEHLCDVWLSGAEHTSVTAEMADYIIGAGVYGTLENHVAISGERKGGRFKYMLGRIFAPYRTLKLYYPRLEKYPVLLPYYQVKRWFRLIFTKANKRAFAEIKYNSSVSAERRERLVAMCRGLDLIK